MVLDDVQREPPGGIVGVPGAQLERQAFTRAAAADSNRLQVLQMSQGDRELVDSDHRFRREERGDILEALREVSVLVERIDQQPDQRAVVPLHVEQRELLVQMVAQGRCVVRRNAAIVVAVVLAPLPGRRELGRRVVVPLRWGGLLRGRRRSCRRVHGRCPVPVAFFALEDRILRERLFDLLVELHRRELQQADRLLQLRRERQVLREPELQCGFHLSREAAVS